jgi:SAM-dependent methyltransferase
MSSNLAHWDLKHLGAVEKPPAEPASIVCELLPLLPRGVALDLACGRGANTQLLASRCSKVVAVDGALEALKALEGRGPSAHSKVAWAATIDEAARSKTSGIYLVQADLEETHIPASSFDLILCIRYLQRSLFRSIERALLPGGMLLFETFTTAQLRFSGGPHNPAYLLEPGELRTSFPSLETLFYRELSAGQGIASLAARKLKENA